MRKRPSNEGYLLCVRNHGYPAPLLVRRLYRRVPDRTAAAHRLVKVVDDPGEDNLYPEQFVVPIALSRPVTRAMRNAA